MLSDKLKTAISSLSGQLAGDLTVDSDEDFAAILAETTLDANRLSMFGYVEEEKELKGLVKLHGWDTIVGLAEKYVRY